MPPEAAQNESPKAYIYTRVSHLDSADSGLSIEAQKENCLRYLEFIRSKYNLELGCTEPQQGVYIDEAVSAYQAETREFLMRPQGIELHKQLKKGDHVIFARLDRAFRWVPDFYKMKELWDRMGVTIHFVDLQIDLSTATGKLFAGIMAIFAQWHSDYISERTKEALAAKRARGGSLNQKKPRGQKKVVNRNGEKILVPDRRQQAIMRCVRYLRDTKRLSYMAISDRLEAMAANRENRKPRYLWARHDEDGTLWDEKNCFRAYHDARAQWPQSSSKSPCVKAGR